MKTALLFALVLVSNIAFAGQENRGGARNGTVIATCEGSNLGITLYHNVTSGQFTAVVSEQFGTTDASSFTVSEITPAPGVMGGTMRYLGTGFSLSICRGCYSPSGMPGQVSIASLGIQQSVSCKRN